jgi:hypothetical protein
LVIQTFICLTRCSQLDQKDTHVVFLTFPYPIFNVRLATLVA